MFDFDNFLSSLAPTPYSERVGERVKLQIYRSEIEFEVTDLALWGHQVLLTDDPQLIVECGGAAAGMTPFIPGPILLHTSTRHNMDVILHEIGHLKTTRPGMRELEKERRADEWAVAHGASKKALKKYVNGIALKQLWGMIREKPLSVLVVVPILGPFTFVNNWLRFR